MDDGDNGGSERVLRDELPENEVLRHPPRVEP